MRAAGFVLVLTLALTVADAARAAEGLTHGDFAWLQSNLNLAADSPVIATLDRAQKTRLHGLIDHARGGADRKRQAVVSFLTGSVGHSFEAILRQSLQAPPNPAGAMTSRSVR